MSSSSARRHGGDRRSEERRRTPRHPRRIRVRFWVEGQERATSGVTNNLSLSGAFITAPEVHARGTRLRLELNHDDGPVMIEGRVAHAHRVPVELRALGTSGMGVRFLPPEDLVAPLLPEELIQDAAEEPERSAGPRVFSVSFDGVSDFLQCYHRDLVNGGIFIRTARPRGIRSLIDLEFQVPGRAEPLTSRGRVVQRIEPRAGEDPPRGGMGIELLEVENLLAELRPLVERLGG